MAGTVDKKRIGNFCKPPIRTLYICSRGDDPSTIRIFFFPSIPEIQ